jgi:hypothetical protein
MPQTIEVTLYQFNELSDTAKERAREWWRECESQEFGASGELNEPIESAAKLLGFTFRTHNVNLMGGGIRVEPDIYWQLGDQGSGASFRGYYQYVKGSVKKITAEFPQDTKLHQIAAGLADLQKQYRYGLTANIETSGRDVHKYAMCIAAETTESDSGTLLTLVRDFADWIYKYITDEWEYRMSDENVEDAITANEYTFRANGKRSDD